jgi:hypothetical protein
VPVGVVPVVVPLVVGVVAVPAVVVGAGVAIPS